MAKKYTFEVDGESKEFIELSAHNNTVAKVRQTATEGFISINDEKYKGLVSKVNSYETKEWENKVHDNYLTKYKINGDYKSEVIKLAGISKDMDDETIDKKIGEFSNSDKNNIFLLKEEELQPVVEEEEETPEPEEQKVSGNAGWFGGGFFGRKNK